MTSIIQYTSEDFLQTRFVTRPMSTVALSAMIGLNPQHHPVYKKWSSYVAESLGTIELRTLSALIVGTSCFPDFLKPFPNQQTKSFEDELEIIASMPEGYIEEELLWLCDTSPPTADVKMYMKQPRRLRDRVVDELEIYWKHVISSQWPHFRTLLETDILYRSRQLATIGYGAMFSDLSSQLEVDKKRLKINSVHLVLEIDLNGTGVILEPNVFADRLRIQSSPLDEGIALTYPARGAGLWRNAVQISPSEALGNMIGETRARLLIQLQKPITTLELAHVHCLSPGAVSRHLGHLSECGVVEKKRMGKRVYYSLNQRGESLLELFNLSGEGA